MLQQILEFVFYSEQLSKSFHWSR